MKFRVAALFVLLLPAAAHAASAGPLTVSAYLDQVRDSNAGVRGFALNSQGAMQRSEEGQLVYAPQVIGTVQHTDDASPTLAPVFQGDRTVTDTWSVGVSKTTEFGLQSSLTYNLTQSTIYGVSPTLIPSNSYANSSVAVSVTQPLWRNGFGRTTREAQQATDAQARATALSNSYQSKTALSDAETRYWRLAVARESIRVYRESLDRAIKMRDYRAGREKLQLADRADLLQSEAAMRQRKLDLKASTDEERTASRAFNLARGLDADRVDEQLTLPDVAGVTALTVPARADKRDDVLAAEQTLAATSASNEAARDKNLPSLNLVASLAYYGQDPSTSTATSTSFTTVHPKSIVGLQFAMPLGRRIDEARAGYLKEILGAQQAVREKLLEQENDWNDLVLKFNEAKERLALAVELQDAQREKLDEERNRLLQGRTTTYQVFLFETDYLNAQLSVIQTQSTLLSLYAQMRTYRSEQ